MWCACSDGCVLCVQAAVWCVHSDSCVVCIFRQLCGVCVQTAVWCVGSDSCMVCGFRQLCVCSDISVVYVLIAVWCVQTCLVYAIGVENYTFEAQTTHLRLHYTNYANDFVSAMRYRQV